MRSFAAPAYGSFSPSIPAFSSRMTNFVVVTFFNVQVDFFNDELALLVLLARFIRFRIGPSDHAFATSTKNVRYAVHSSHEKSVFSRTNSDIDTLIKEIGAA
jgi:hypothetical protein